VKSQFARIVLASANWGYELPLDTQPIEARCYRLDGTYQPGERAMIKVERSLLRRRLANARNRAGSATFWKSTRCKA
jgi:hypothetical protein